MLYVCVAWVDDREQKEGNMYKVKINLYSFFFLQWTSTEFILILFKT